MCADSVFFCSNCGYKSIKWLGKCPLCGEWDTFSREEAPRPDRIKKVSPPRLLKEIGKDEVKRISTGVGELDRILGGGLVQGEVVLVGGEPGIGKSTLLLEVASRLSRKEKTLYLSAEESPQQVVLRFQRIAEKDNEENDNLFILDEDELSVVFEYIKDKGFKFIVIDSIQVVQWDKYEGSKGSVTQIKSCADYLTRIAKSLDVVIFIVGHVTKEGAIAGPKLLEHIVDCVLYFEGESMSNYRILRSTKNRFGPTGDIAVFEMKSCGLMEVQKTNDIFLPHREESFSGSCVVCAIEGSRPILIELQSLVSRANFGVARRRSLGFDFNRFSLLIAIIEKRLKIYLSKEDVFLNVAGGLKLNDPAADLGAVIAIISSFKDKEIPSGLVFIAEVGLAGELRRVNNINFRLKEAERAGFKEFLVPEVNLKEVDKKFINKAQGFTYLNEVAKRVFG